MDYKHTLIEISEHTGLTVNFIRRIITKSKIVKKEYSKRSVHNELLFNDNGLVYFRESAVLKNAGNTLSDIVIKLDQSVSSHVKEVIKQSDPENQMLELIKNAHTEIVRAKDETLQAQREVIAQLESKILLLTESKVPEQDRQQLELERKEIERMKRELEDQKQAAQAKRQALIDDLARVSWFQFGRKADLIRQLRELS